MYLYKSQTVNISIRKPTDRQWNHSAILHNTRHKGKHSNEFITSIDLQNNQRLKFISLASHKVRANPTINAKCPNLKHKAQLVYVQNTSTKTRFKTKSNDQNRSQSFA